MGNPSGLSSTADGSVCEVCAKGKFTTVSVDATSDSCEVCPLGWGGTLTHSGPFHHQVAFTDATAMYSKLHGGAESCTECPAGWFADDDGGSQPCQRCPAGWSSCWGS